MQINQTLSGNKRVLYTSKLTCIGPVLTKMWPYKKTTSQWIKPNSVSESTAFKMAVNGPFSRLLLDSLSSTLE